MNLKNIIKKAVVKEAAGKILPMEGTKPKLGTKAKLNSKRVASNSKRQLPPNWLKPKPKAKSCLVLWSKSLKRLALMVVCLVQLPITTSPKS